MVDVPRALRQTLRRTRSCGEKAGQEPRTASARLPAGAVTDTGGMGGAAMGAALAAVHQILWVHFIHRPVLASGGVGADSDGRSMLPPSPAKYM